MPEVPVTYGHNELGRRVSVGRKDKARGVPSSRLQIRCGPAANYMLGLLPMDALSGLVAVYYLNGFFHGPAKLAVR